jgi:Asp-tRNA(Asn)/Glu-tRNA(Gln) amidotransferase A subunit family amidase
MALSLSETLAALEGGRMTALSHVEGVLQRAAESATLGAFITLDAEDLRAAARASDGRRAAGHAGVLDGAALAIKDNIDTADLPTTGGTRALRGAAAADAPPLARLRAAGALVAGKTNLHELALGITSNNAAFGPVRNPHDQGLIAGGSSGGTAAAIAAGIVPAGLGTDTGGSVRIPAALCGITGFRPTVGRYPGGGVVPLSSTRDTIGPMGRTVADVALLDAVMAAEARMLAVPEASALRLGVPRRILWEGLEPEIATRCEAALARLAAAGVSLVETNPDDLWADAAAASFPIVLYETLRELPAYCAARGLSFADLLAGVASPDVRGILESQLGEGAMPKAAYRAALDVHRPAMRRNWARWFAAHDLHGAVFPTTPLRARPIGADATVRLNGADLPTFPTFIRNTDHGSVMGVPGISLPLPGDGLPVGLELDGLAGQDRALLGIAARLEGLLAH